MSIPTITVLSPNDADIIVGSGTIKIRGARDWRQAAAGYRIEHEGHTWIFDQEGLVYRVRYVDVYTGTVRDVVWSLHGDPPAVGCIESLDADVGWIWDGSQFHPPETEGILPVPVGPGQ